ncbi:maltokinase N-terminal cap-like domain-containing protein [Actinomycetota bacterium Odt1-20B]
MTTPPPLTDDRLAPALHHWLPHQRWYAGKDRTLSGVRIVHNEPITLSDASCGHIVILQAEFTDGTSDHFQTAIGHTTATPPPTAADHIITTLDGTVVYEAMADPNLVQALFHLVSRPRTSEALAGHCEASGSDHLSAHPVTACQPLGVEQSNTSVVVDDRYLVKFFRRLHPGTNPDLEVQRALLTSDNGRIAPVYGALEGRIGSTPVTLAIIQRFLPTATDGWEIATEAFRPPCHHADLATDAQHMGRAVGQVHTALAEAFGTTPLTRADLVQLATAMHRQLDQATAAVPELAPYEGLLRTAYDDLAALPTGLSAQRVHGDLHLGQLLRSDEGWVVIDFEGEPSAPIHERTEHHSPLRDIAGMLRSFDYAAAAAQPGGDTRTTVGQAQDAFCHGYSTVTGTDPRAEAALLHAYTLHKAVYETRYEAAHRPAFLRIPLQALDRLLFGNSPK